MDLTPRWLTLKAASRYSSIGQRKLIELVEDAKIRGGQRRDNGNNPWFFDRDSIDKYMEGMIADKSMAFYRCERKTYLAGIDGKDIR